MPGKKTGTDCIALLNGLEKEEPSASSSTTRRTGSRTTGSGSRRSRARTGWRAAIDADRRAWERFTVVEAKRIMERLGIAPGGGIPALLEASSTGSTRVSTPRR